MVDTLLLHKLLDAYNKHGNIIIGVDFDGTFYEISDDKAIQDRCHIVRTLLSKLSEKTKICLYSVADKQSLKYKVEIMKIYGVKPDFVNESPIKKWNCLEKPYFNILLDDKAGLDQSIATLKEFHLHIS